MQAAEHGSLHQAVPDRQPVSVLVGASDHGALLVKGVIGILARIVTFALPVMTAIALLYLIAFWAILTGVLEIAAGVQNLIANEWALILMGALSLPFGAFILFAPGAGALATVLWIGVYALIFGIFLLVLAFRLRGFRHVAAEGRA